MDDDIEIVEHDILENPQIKELFSTLSLVKIEVHEGDDAERIIEDLTEDYQNETELQEYPEEDTEDHVQETQEDYPEQIPEDYDNSNTEDCVETQDYSKEDREFFDVSIKEEIEEFDGTDYTDFNEVPAEPYNNDLPPEDIYHFHNKIILGTKPCQSTSEVNLLQETVQSIQIDFGYQNDVEKENLDVVVLLEDWGLKLQQSLCFCKECGILFATRNGFDAHNMTAHSFLVAVSKNFARKSTAKPAYARKSTSALFVKKNRNIARKSTGSNNVHASKFCHHCNVVFPDHTALIKHLYELLPLKQFKCNVCDALFETQNDLIDHSVVHVKFEKSELNKEKNTDETIDFKKKLLYEEDVKKKRPISPKKEVKAIPMSALFQCTKCNIHFLSAFAGLQHWIHCHPGINTKISACKTCKRKLRDTDSVTHKKQHEICAKFKVYKITNNIFERTLCKCPKCELHFNDLTLKPHFKHCGKIPTAHCQKCNILIPKAKIHWHSKKHVKQNLKPKDFIIVQHYLENKAVKRKLKPVATPTKKIKLEFTTKKISKETSKTDKNLHKYPGSIKKEPLDDPINVPVKEEREADKRIKMVNRLKFETGHKIRMYFCTNCKGCCVNDSNRKIHLSKQCKFKSKMRNSVICTECGLQFNTKTILSHKNKHKKRSFTIHDLVFYHIGTLRPIVPSMPTYPQCKNCKITFFCTKVQNEHICGEDYESCNACGEKFHNSAYKIHKEFHKLIKTGAPRKMEAKMIPELLKNYESFNTMWNIVYSCSKCDIITDVYDKAIEHSQAHINNEASTKNIKCYICNLKFDETCWSKHSELHSRMMINSKDFKILTYHPNTLLTEEWFQLFDIIPEEQIRQITDRSLYGYERGVQMKLLKDGRSEFTLHCCSICKVCFPNNEIAKHMKTTCKNPANVCKICDIPFFDINTLRIHEILHLNDIKKEEFRIVTFTKVKGNNIKLEFKISTAVFELYKCRRCNVCVHRKHNIEKHNCLPEHQAKKCHKCNELFNKRFMLRHEEKHRIHPNFNAKNIKIHPFNLPGKTDKDYDDDDVFEPVIRKYKKRNHSKTLNSANVVKTKTVTSNSRKAETSKIAKADTSKRSKADTSKRSKADASKTSKPDISNTTKGETKTAKLFKCNCGLHYTSIKTIEAHIQKRCPDFDISKEKCSKCGLLFPTDVLVNHLCKHHSKNTKIEIESYQKPEEPETSFVSVESTSENPVKENKRKTANFLNQPAQSPIQNCAVKLYKCSECNIYFMTQNTCYKHVYKAHQPIDPKQYIECKLCGLQFTIKSLSQHISRHHQKDFNLDNILVEEYHPPVGKGPPKIDIYVAAEKVQSLIVTSSIEESRINS